MQVRMGCLQVSTIVYNGPLHRLLVREQVDIPYVLRSGATGAKVTVRYIQFPGLLSYFGKRPGTLAVSFL